MKNIIPLEILLKNKKYRESIKEKIIAGERVNIYNFANYMRNNPTYGEYILYNEFLSKRPEKFRRQHIIKPFIVDFYCSELNLIIEIDGSSHEGRFEYDKKRENFLISKGNFMVRVTEEDIEKNPTGVVPVLADIFKYMGLLKNYKIKPKVGEVFVSSPLVFGNPEILSLFTEEERKPVEDVFKKY